MADLAEAILGKVAEVLRANQLQKALQLLQDMAKSNQALTVKHMAKLADSMGMRSPGLETCNGRYSTCWLGIWTCMNTVFWAWTSHYTTLCTTLLLTYSRCENIRFVQWKIMIDKDFFMWLKRIVYIVHDASLAFFILLNPRFWVSHLIFFFQNIV